MHVLILIGYIVYNQNQPKEINLNHQKDTVYLRKIDAINSPPPPLPTPLYLRQADIKTQKSVQQPVKNVPSTVTRTSTRRIPTTTGSPTTSSNEHVLAIKSTKTKLTSKQDTKHASLPKVSLYVRQSTVWIETQRSWVNR